MRIKDFIDFLKESVKDDYKSKLNEEVDSNEEDLYDYDDDSTKSPSDKYDKNSDYGYYDYDDDPEDDDIEDDDTEHLLYLLRTMFRNNGVDVDVTSKGIEDIVISCYMRNKEDLKSVIKVFEVATKLKRDILSQYDSEFDMWSSKTGPILTFTFMLNEGLEDDNMPF